jgi:aspartate/methionine/tyrosine aminotransferase
VAKLSPEKQRVLDALLEEVRAPEFVEQTFDDIYDVVEFLVHHSTAFSGNPELREAAKKAVRSNENKEVNADGETGDDTNEV